MLKQLALVSVVGSALALSGAAQAHVTLHPNALPAGSFTTFVVRVPNERPKAVTTKVDVKFPRGFLFLSYEPKPGWQAQIIYRKLAKPVKLFGETFKQEVGRVVWSGRLAPGQFVEFPLSAAMPAMRAGTVLTFKALQTYSNGEIVRWIGAPNADEPAPQVMLTSSNSQVADFPNGIPAIKKARSSHTPLIGIVLGVPLGFAGLLLARARRRR
jgi:uncharacterized protein YcnI